MGKNAGRAEQHICLLSQLKSKEVIALDGGRRLGHISDVEIDFERSCIVALVLPEERGRMIFFEPRQERCIPWEQVERVGEDVVLVRESVPAMVREKKGFCLFASKE